MKEPPRRTPQRMQRPAARLITPYPLPLPRRWKMRPQATQPTRPPHSRHRRRRSSSMSWSPRLAKTSIRYTLPAAPRHRRGRRQPAACAGTKDERSPAAPPIRSGQLVEIRPTKCTRTRHAAAREQTRAQARLTTASTCPECRMLSAISWSPDLWSSLHSVRPMPGSPSQNHQQSDAASGPRRVHCPRGTCYEVALKSSGKSRVVLARYARNGRLSDALHQKAFAALTASPGARGFYDAHRERGNTHHQALRVLGNKTHRHPARLPSPPPASQRDHRLGSTNIRRRCLTSCDRGMPSEAPPFRGL